MDKHFIIYKTTNLLNGRYYIGMHVTTNIDDGYLGSGRRIKAEIKKHGRKNFTRVVLEELPSKAELIRCEAELVTDELRADPLCLNLKNGGEGGWDHLNDRSLHHKERRTKGTVNSNKSPNRNWKEQSAKAIQTKRHNGFKPTWTFFDGMLGKKHSEESKRLMSVSQTGSRNGSYGTCWVKKDGSSLKINKQELDEYLRNGYLKGRVIKAGKVFMDTCGSSKPE